MEAFFHGLPVWVNCVLFVAGIVIIDRGSRTLVVSSVSISEKTGIPKIIVGATIMSVATTFPEFTVSLVATIMGYRQMAVGNIIGSCACNIGLVCGLCLLILPVVVDKRVILEKGGIMILGAAAATAFAFYGILPRWGGVLLLAGLGSRQQGARPVLEVAPCHLRLDVDGQQRAVEVLDGDAEVVLVSGFFAGLQQA